MNIVPSSLVLVSAAAAAALAAAPPEVGEKAPEFSLSTEQGKTVRLSEAIASGPVVLVVLRGYPGYQCPLCNRQVRDFLQNAAGFAERGVKVIMIYPGPAENLALRAQEFRAGKTLPAHFELVVDPDYRFTTLYGLRWDAPKETAYPATFLIDSKGIVVSSRISNSHGGRASAGEVLDWLRRKKAGE